MKVGKVKAGTGTDASEGKEGHLEEAKSRMLGQVRGVTVYC